MYLHKAGMGTRVQLAASYISSLCYCIVALVQKPLLEFPRVDWPESLLASVSGHGFLSWYHYMPLPLPHRETRRIKD